MHRLAATLPSLAVMAVLPCLAPTAPAVETPPNIVVILTDDLGYADLGCYGNKRIRTPNLDRMAAEGARLTSFYSGGAVCSPTRAALMTGCYPKRVSMHIGVVMNDDPENGLASGEFTIAEMMKARGYATGCFGKWHLGTKPAMMPTAQGFDDYFGFPGENHGKSDLVRGLEVVAKLGAWQPVTAAKSITDEAVRFIQQHKNRPFFVYLPHGTPHTPLLASPPFKDKSQQGLYGDMIEEMDANCGQILDTLRANGLDQRTLVIFSSDNGSASAAAIPFHGGKGSSWEGGMRVPFIARWPQRIPAGLESNAIVTMMDVMPTVAAITGASLAKNVRIDGEDVSEVLTKPGAKAKRETMLYYNGGGQLAAIRNGKWKLHLIQPKQKYTYPKEALLDTKPKTKLPWLYDLDADPGETVEITSQHKDVVAQLTAKAGELDAEMTANARPRADGSIGPRRRKEDGK